jgi:dTDP-4-amino-4,6-dideoxygalactose transaminase
LGTYGDIGFSSIWKILPVPDGALLFINNEKLVNKKENIDKLSISQSQLPQKSKKGIYAYILNSLLCDLELRYAFRARFIRYIYRKLFPRVELNYSQLFQNSKVRISDISLRVINNIDLEDAFEKRRQNYNFWLSVLSGREDLHCVFEGLPNGTCPLCFAVIEKEADKFSMEMLGKGIYAYHWSLLPEEVQDNPEYPNANFLAKHLVLLPVHQSLSPDRLAKIVRK